MYVLFGIQNGRLIKVISLFFSWLDVTHYVQFMYFVHFKNSLTALPQTFEDGIDYEFSFVFDGNAWPCKQTTAAYTKSFDHVTGTSFKLNFILKGKFMEADDLELWEHCFLHQFIYL